MPRTVTDSFGDEVTAADFDDYVPPVYKRMLARHPDCRDPDHPGCQACMDDPEDFVETVQFNDEPVPYDNNKEA